MESFESFADAATPWLFGLALALANNEHDAWDLTQETLVKLLARWPHVELSNPRGYARTVMVRLNVDRLHRLRRHRSLPILDEGAVGDPDSQGLEDWLMRGIRELSPKQRTAIVLHYAEDLGVDAIAVEMRCSTGTVRSHLSRGMARLRQHATTAHVGKEAEHGSR